MPSEDDAVVRVGSRRGGNGSRYNVSNLEPSSIKAGVKEASGDDIA